MKSRILRGFSLAICTIAALGTSAASQPKTKVVDHAEHHEAMLACAKACSDCQRECDACGAHCARMLEQGKKEHLKSLGSCQDCATICSAAAQIVARGGPFAVLICEPCANGCAQCAKQCEKFPDDQHMKKCAAECRKCEKACREMIKHMGHASSNAPVNR